MERTQIAGIVTWSDLLKVPVLVLAVSLIAELECEMNRRILEQYMDGQWVALLDKHEQQKIRKRQGRLKSQDLSLAPIELADLSHKAKLLRGVLAPGRDFYAELAKVVQLRNEVGHVKNIVRSDDDLKDLVERIETVEAWLDIVKTRRAVAAATAL